MRRKHLDHPEARRYGVLIAASGVTKGFLIFLVLPYLAKLYPTLYNIQLSSDLYDEIAWNLVLGNGYRVDPDTSLTMLRSPGFVLILAGVFFFFGKSLLAVQIMNFAFSCITALLVYFMTKKLLEDKLIAWLAAIFVFFFPGTLIADLRGGLESTQMLFITATTMLAYKAVESGRYFDYVVLGLVFGFSVLIKASVAFMLPIFFIYVIVTQRSWGALYPLLVRCSVAGFMTVLVSMPWVARNYQISGEFVPTMTVTGKSLYFGVYAVENYTSEKALLELLRESARKENMIAKEMGFTFKEGYYPLFFRPEDEHRYYSKLGELALMILRDDPALLGKSLVFNAVAFWVLGRTQMTTIMNIAIILPVLVLFCFGILMARRRKCNYLGLLLLPIIAYIVPYLFIAAQARYYIPIVPLMAFFIALPLAKISLALFKQNRPDESERPS